MDYNPPEQGPISLSPPEPTPELINLAPQQSDVPLPPAQQEAKGFKGDFALAGILPPGAYSSSLKAGQEAQARKEAAAKADFQRMQAQQQAIASIAAKQGPIKPEDVELVRKLVDAKIDNVDPDTVMEEHYGKAYMDQLKQSEAANEKTDTLPPQLKGTIDTQASTLIAKREFALNQLQQRQAEVAAQGWIPWIADQAKSLVPGYDELKLRGNTPGVGSMSGGLLGENLDQQARALLQMPLPQFKAEYTRILNNLARDNPSAAERFAKAVVDGSTETKFVNNWLEPLNIVGFADVAVALKGVGRVAPKVAAKQAEDLATYKEAAKQMVQATAQPNVTRATIVEATGDVGEAAVQKVAQDLTGELRGTYDPVKQSIDDLTGYMKIAADNLYNNPGQSGRELAVRLSQQAQRSIDTITQAMVEKTNVERIPEVLAQTSVIRDLKDELTDVYKSIHGTILDISNIKHNPVTNTYSVDLILGKPGGELFFSKQVARNFAEANKLNGYVIEQKGLVGWQIRLTNKNLPETSNFIRDTYGSTLETRAPKSILNDFLGHFRTPEETLSLADRMNRKTVTYGNSVLEKAVQEEGKYIKQLVKGAVDPDENNVLSRKLSIKDRKKRWNEWERMVASARDINDPRTGDLGYFYQNVGELEEAYLKMFNRMPDAVETQAYFAFTRLVEMDAVMRSIALYRNKARVGAEQLRFSTINDQGVKVDSPFFEGTLRKDLPGGADTIMYVSKVLGKEKFFSANTANPALWKEVKDGVKNGNLKIMEVYDPSLGVFEEFGSAAGKRVRYIITDNVETKPLSMDQLPRRGGGHFEYDYDFYIKQPKISVERIGRQVTHWYDGDTTIMAVGVRAMGEKFGRVLDDVRRLIKAKDLEAAKAKVEAELPMDWKEVHGWFREKRLNGKKIPPRLSLDQVIRVVPKDRMISDIDDNLAKQYTQLGGTKSTFRDGTKGGSLARQYPVGYTQQRENERLMAVRDLGGKDKPVWAVEPAKMIDPIPTMNRALSRITNSLAMDDYKIYSVERWLKEAGPYLKESVAELRASPFYYFNHPEWKPGVDIATKNGLLAQQMQIKQLMGTPSSMDGFLYSATQKLTDSMYKRLGGEVVEKGAKALEHVPDWMIYATKNPFTFLRGVAFHAKLGFFNPAQLMVQTQTYANILALAGPAHAASAAYGAMLSQWARMNGSKEIMDKLDNLMTKNLLPGGVKWRPGEFAESMREMGRTGFGNVAGEYAMRDDTLQLKVFKSGVDSFLDAGTTFFREGERSVRYGAWHTAYKEFRDANPTKQIGNRERQQILERADLLTVNMSRASSSTLHTGVFSIPAQFLAYQIRLAELFFGNRITHMDRGRMIATYAALYGAPMSIGLTGLPLGESIRQAAIENGYVVGDNFLNSMIMEGLPSIMLALATGKGDIREGNFYNIGQRYSAGGFEFAREALNSDEPWWTLVGGASFSTLSGTFSRMDGFTRAMVSAIKGDQEAFPISAEDIVDVFKEISTVNNAWRGLAAIHSGRWLSKKEAYLTDTSGASAIFMSLTGLQPQSVNDLHIMSTSKKSQQDLEKHAQEQFTREFRRAIRHQDNDPQQANKYFTRAFTYLKVAGFPEEKYAKVIAQASKDYESMIDRMNWDFYVRTPLPGKRETLQDAYNRKSDIKGN